MQIRDNTLVIVLSDNGASQEGLQNGAANADRYRNYDPETVAEILAQLDKLGSPETDPLIRWAGRWPGMRRLSAGSRTRITAATPIR